MKCSYKPEYNCSGELRCGGECKQDWEQQRFDNFFKSIKDNCTVDVDGQLYKVEDVKSVFNHDSGVGHPVIFTARSHNYRFKKYFDYCEEMTPLENKTLDDTIEKTRIPEKLIKELGESDSWKALEALRLSMGKF